MLVLSRFASIGWVMAFLLAIALPGCSAVKNCQPGDAACSDVAAFLYLDYTVKVKRWVAVGDTGTIQISNDGVAWTTVASGTVNNLQNVVYGGNNRWVAVGPNDTMLYSTDGGETWIPASVPSSGVNHFGLATDGAGRYIAAGTVADVYVSDTGGDVWYTTPSAQGAVKNHMLYCNAVWLTVSNGGITFSSDGLNYTVAAASPGGAPGRGSCIASGWSIASTMTPFTYRSTDGGNNWGGATTVATNIRRTVFVHNNTFFALGDNNDFRTSTNADTWTAPFTISSPNITAGVSDGDSTIVIVGNAGAILYSNDSGTTFSSGTGLQGNNLRGVAYGLVDDPDP